MSVYCLDERRLVLRLMAYWDNLRVDRTFPSWRQIDSDAIGEDWLHCLLIELADPLEESRFQHVGAALAVDVGSTQDLRLAACPSGTLLHHALHYLDRLLVKQVPMSLGGQAPTASGEDILYRSILLPLSDDGTRIDHVLGAANGRPVVNDAR